MTRPVMTLEEVNSYRPVMLEEKVWLVGVRGWNGLNQIGIYDDAIFLITPDEVLGFNANTDPSRLLPGVATLIPGTYYYKKGIHGMHHLDLTDQNTQQILAVAMKTQADIGRLTYWAFRQDSDVSITRQGDINLHTDNVNNRYWIDIHRGGFNTTSSAGCQTIHPDQWDEAKEKGYAAMDQYSEKRIPYVLALKK
jgi:lysozyme